MKMTQNPETGGLIIDGEGALVEFSDKTYLGGWEEIRNFHFSFKPETEFPSQYSFLILKVG